MNNKTMINPMLQQTAPTMINNEIIEEYNRQNNIDASQNSLVEEETTVLDKYRIIKRLEVASGEADLYLCDCREKKYVAKIYKRRFAIKAEVILALKGISSPYVATLVETGEYKGYPVEILPYYEKGSLQGKKLSEEYLIHKIIPNINEGLHAIHAAGIIHKDLKPSNIMINSDGETVSIIDFGISSSVEDNKTILVTKTGMTPEYSAPETFKNIFYEGSDYYSFGITLFELFCGYTPYANMQQEQIEQYISVQKIPFPETMPVRLQELISALTYYDISNRNNKNNPHRRWTYDEVCRWLKGESLVIPGEGIANFGRGDMLEFQFMGKRYTDSHQLVLAMAKNWEEGKKQLFRGYLTSHFRKYNAEAARKCQAAEEEARRENGRDDMIFWKLLYQIDPKLNGLYWKGQSYESIPAFGRDVLEKLWDKDDSQFSYYASILEEKLLTQYVLMTQPKNEKLKKAAAAIEDSYRLEKANDTDMRRTYYLMAYTLSGQKLLLLDGEQFRTVGELVEYMRCLLDESYKKFELLCHRLVDYDGNLDFQFETWLIAIGKQKEIDKWRTSMNE